MQLTAIENINGLSSQSKKIEEAKSSSQKMIVFSVLFAKRLINYGTARNSII